MSNNSNNSNVKFDQGKPNVELVLGGFAKALLGVSEVGTAGSKIYSRNGWKGVPDGVERYQSAGYRHKLKRQEGELYDKDTGLLHILHECWNDLAVAELTIKELGSEVYLPYTKESLYSSFEYDSNKGLLTYKSSGKLAGYLDLSSNEVVVLYSGKLRKVSHIIWIMIYGFEPAFVKYADGDSTNLKSTNLLGESRVDSTPSTQKTSQYVGVSKCRDRWRSRIMVDGVRVDLGCHYTEEAARDAYLKFKSYLVESDDSVTKVDLDDEAYKLELDDFLTEHLVHPKFKEVVKSLLEIGE